MASPDDDNPTVVSYPDHDVITPPHRLRNAVTLAGGERDDPVARAEVALSQLSSEFATWMYTECERLEAARRDVRRCGLNEQTHDTLFRAAHDIRGEAATFGFPRLTGVADSLCRLLEHTPEMKRIPPTLIDQHVDAVRAMMREHARPDLDWVARALTARLREVTDDFLRAENCDRPDRLANIFAPPLAPDNAA